MSALGRLKGWETMMLGLLAAIVAFNSFGSPYFLSVGNFVNLFQLSIEKSIVALTMALVIIGGEIDLSVASIMGLSACVMAWTFHEGVPMPLAILIALAAGTVAGLNNAFWIATCRPAVAGGYSRRPYRLSRHRPHSAGRPRDRRFS